MGEPFQCRSCGEFLRVPARYSWFFSLTSMVVSVTVAAAFGLTGWGFIGVASLLWVVTLIVAITLAKRVLPLKIGLWRDSRDVSLFRR